MSYAFNDDKSKSEIVKEWVDIPKSNDAGIKGIHALKYYKNIYDTVFLALNVDFNNVVAGRSIVLATTPQGIEPAGGQQGLGYGRNLGIFMTYNHKRVSLEVNNSQIKLYALDALSSGDWIVCEASYNPTY